MTFIRGEGCATKVCGLLMRMTLWVNIQCGCRAIGGAMSGSMNPDGSGCAGGYAPVLVTF